ncbi:TlpA family protein disulfide reductase [Derxia gummosa]|uniref:TlpA family protein disulfide reductase n=1 Tax=Derxia gummosa DSM 723 TaxID=1121388 RepID=A0A8B6X9B5_9BURK|nr:TlpA disulfide reductase family protein [Derxia gummosa]
MKLKFGPLAVLLIAAVALGGGLLFGLHRDAQRYDLPALPDGAGASAGNDAAAPAGQSGGATDAAPTGHPATGNQVTGAAGADPAGGNPPAAGIAGAAPASFRPTEPAVTALFAARFDDLDGRARGLAEFAGRTVVVNFWATWCAPCVEEMPGLQAIATDLAPAGVSVVGIAIDNPQPVRDFARAHGIGYALLLGAAEGTEHARALGDKAGGLPYTVVIGPDGQVRDRHAGRLDLAALRTTLAASALATTPR